MRKIDIKSDRIKKPLHWSLSHYPYYPAWGSMESRGMTVKEQTLHHLAAATWYGDRRQECYARKDKAAAMGYLHLQRGRILEAVSC